MNAQAPGLLLAVVLTAACSGNDAALTPPTSAPSPVPTVTRVPTPVPTPTVLPTPTPSGSPSPSPSPSVAPSPTLEPTSSPSPTPDPMAEARRLFEQEQALRARAEAL